MDKQIQSDNVETKVNKSGAFVRKALQIALFLCVVAAILLILNAVLRKKWSYKDNSAQQIVESFYQEKEDTIDVLCLGQSTIRNGVSSLEMYNKYGFTTFSRATSIQLPIVSYYLLEEAFQTQKNIKAVILDATSIANSTLEQKDESFSAKLHEAVDYMPWSKEKEAMVREALNRDVNASYMEYLVPLYAYHERWEELTEIDFRTNEADSVYCYKGQSPMVKTVDGNLPDDYMVTESENEEDKSFEIVDELAEDYKKIIALCEEKGIKVVMVKTPGATWNMYKHQKIAEFASAQGISFIDFNMPDIQKEIDFNAQTDFCDSGKHPNITGAQKMSDYLGAYLKSICDLPDRRTDPAFESWGKAYDQYACLLNAAELARETNLIGFLQKLRNPNYIVMLATRNDTSKNYSKYVAEAFEALGITAPFGEHRCLSYLALLDGGKLVHEETDEDPEDHDNLLTYSTTYDGHSIYISSYANQLVSNEAVIIFDGETLDSFSSGFNFAVYDKQVKQIVATNGFNIGKYGKQYFKPDPFADYGRDPVGYLSNLANDDYITVIGAGKNASKYMPTYVNEQLKEMGLKPLDGETNRPYLAIMNGESIIWNEYGEADDELEFSQDIEEIQVEAECDNSMFSAEIGETKVNHKMSGLTVLVYSKKDGELVSQKRFAWTDNYATGTDYSNMSDIQKVLDAARKDGADILCMYSPEQASDGVPEEVIAALKEFGLSGLNTEGYYAGIAAGDGTVQEQHDAQPVTMEYVREAEPGKDGESIPAVSLVLNPGTKEYKVLVNGIPYSTKGKGLYLMVYHREKQAVLTEKNFTN